MSYTIEVYTISKESVIVDDYHRGVERYSVTTHDVANGVLYDPTQQITKRTMIPIIKVVDFEEKWPGHKQSPFERYIAVEPELKSVLTIEERQEIEELKSKISELKTSIHKSMLETMNDHDMLREWWAQPWFKRVWSALKGRKI